MQQNIAANANIEAKKAPTDTVKATHEIKEANNYAEEAKHSAEEAMVISLKIKKASEESIP